MTLTRFACGYLLHALATLAMLAPNSVWAAAKGAPHAHEHGAVKLDVAIDNTLLSIQLTAPLDSVLGFERAPRNDTERRASADMLARLRGGTGLFVLDAAAGCNLAKTEVQAPVLEPIKSTVAAPSKDAQAKEQHAELEASFEFKCQQPQLLRSLELGLFDIFKRAQRIDVQVAGPKGQSRTTLKRPARSVNLSR